MINKVFITVLVVAAISANAQQPDTASRGTKISLAIEEGAAVMHPPKEVTMPAGGVSVPMDDLDGHPIIEVMLNGRGPFRFAIETGAGITLMTPETALALGLPLTQDALAKPTSNYTIDSISIGGMAQLKKVVVLPYPININGFDGLLGLNSYRDLLLTVDYANRRVSFAKGSLSQANGKDILAVKETSQLLSFEMEINGKPTPVMLDTQYGGSFLAPPELAPDTAFVKPPVVSGYIKNPNEGMTIYRRGRWNSDIKIGNVVFERPLVDVQPIGQNLPKIWFVGIEAIREFVMTLDQGGKLVRFTRSSHVVAAPPIERSIGLLSSLQGDQFIVDSVLSGCEAERQGILAGDTIVSFDGIPASGTTYSKWKSLGRGKRPFKVVLRRRTETKTVTLYPRLEME